LTENIFTPLGMKDSGYDSNTAIIKRRASGYMRLPNGAYVNAGYINMTIPHGAGALYSTTHDLLKWEQGLFAGKVVSKASLDRMTTAFKNDYGFGLATIMSKGRRVITHTGGIDGFNTAMTYYPESKTVVVALGNVQGSAPSAITDHLGALAHGDTVVLTSERKSISVPAALLAKYVGQYQIAFDDVITISLEGDQLFRQVNKGVKQPIFPESETMFFLKVMDQQIEFAPDGSSFVLHQNGRDQKALRK
jgi:CubicO group peptidase (beta-lactamase class C family)